MTLDRLAGDYAPADAVERAAARLAAALAECAAPVAGREPVWPAELRAATMSYAAALRARGEPPQRMLIALKGLLARIQPASWQPDVAQAATSVLVTWAVQGYYQTD